MGVAAKKNEINRIANTWPQSRFVHFCIACLTIPIVAYRKLVHHLRTEMLPAYCRISLKTNVECPVQQRPPATNTRIVSIQNPYFFVNFGNSTTKKKIQFIVNFQQIN